VVVATDLPSHAKLSIQAMRAGKDVLSEVTAFYHPADGVELVETVQETGRAYMMAENCMYEPAMLELDYQVRCGALGDMRYAEGDYVHDVRYLFFEDGQPTWRASLPPLIYCSHPLGPILRSSQARPRRVVAMHTGRAMARTAGGLDMGSMLIQCDNGGAVRIAAGFAVNRHPSSLYVGYFGTRGSLETDRWDERVHLFEEKNRHALGAVSYRPTGRDHHGHTTEGHFGADPRTVECWLEALANGLSMPSDVYQAADMTLPGILGHRSSVSGNIPIDIPDLREASARDGCRGDRLIADPADVTGLISSV
jgi:predicted dehydrogenase